MTRLLKRPTENVLVKYVFTSTEKVKIAASMVEYMGRFDDVTAEAKTIAAQYKSKLSTIAADIRELRNAYRDGFEMRHMDCDVYFDFDDGIVRYFRIDTLAPADPVKERGMTYDEQHDQELPFNGDETEGDETEPGDALSEAIDKTGEEIPGHLGDEVRGDAEDDVEKLVDEEVKSDA